MKRRDFIKNIFYSSSAATLASTASLVPFSNAYAEKRYGQFFSRTLVDVMLLGGADLRFMIAPHPDEVTTTAYVDKFWEARKSLYNTYDNVNKVTLKYASYADVWNGDSTQPLLTPQYEMAEYNGFKFGFHKNATWLKDEFAKGNVAIVCNVYGSINRRHDHSQLIMHTGDRSTSQFVYDRDGWGGRLAGAIGANANVVPVSTGVPPFANTTNASNRLDQVVHVKDSRNFALPKGNANITSSQSILGRSLKSYYEKHGEEIDAKLASGHLPANWPYKKFLQHERSIRTFGDAFKARLDAVLPNILYSFKQLSRRINNKSFGLQCRNLFESMIGSDILKLRTAYMEHTSWDTHHSEKTRLEKNISDVFGGYGAGGLATLQRELRNIEGGSESLVYVFTSDFGRQIKANGANGTDHGEGTYMILVGEEVNGGIYGEMFPQSEIALNSNNQTRFDIQGTDIEGKTSFEHVLAKACDWVQAGTGSTVFPQMQATPLPALETNVDLATLFNPGYHIKGEVHIGTDGKQHVRGVSITAASQNGVTKTSLTKGFTHYDIEGVSNDVYLVTPAKNYFTFNPINRVVNVSNSDAIGVDFTAIPQLHITNFFYDGAYWGDRSIRLLLIAGYNFVPGKTQYTIGGVAPSSIGSESTGYVWLFYPLTASGELVITTPTETYTHPTLIKSL